MRRVGGLAFIREYQGPIGIFVHSFLNLLSEVWVGMKK